MNNSEKTKLQDFTRLKEKALSNMEQMQNVLGARILGQWSEDAEAHFSSNVAEIEEEAEYTRVWVTLHAKEHGYRRESQGRCSACTEEAKLRMAAKRAWEASEAAEEAETAKMTNAEQTARMMEMAKMAEAEMAKMAEMEQAAEMEQ